MAENVKRMIKSLQTLEKQLDECDGDKSFVRHCEAFRDHILRHDQLNSAYAIWLELTLLRHGLSLEGIRWCSLREVAADRTQDSEEACRSRSLAMLAGHISWARTEHYGFQTASCRMLTMAIALVKKTSSEWTAFAARINCAMLRMHVQAVKGTNSRQVSWTEGRPFETIDIEEAVKCTATAEMLKLVNQWAACSDGHLLLENGQCLSQRPCFQDYLLQFDKFGILIPRTKVEQIRPCTSFCGPESKTSNTGTELPDVLSQKTLPVQSDTVKLDSPYDQRPAADGNSPRLAMNRPSTGGKTPKLTIARLPPNAISYSHSIDMECESDMDCRSGTSDEEDNETHCISGSLRHSHAMSYGQTEYQVVGLPLTPESDLAHFAEVQHPIDDDQILPEISWHTHVTSTSVANHRELPGTPAGDKDIAEGLARGQRRWSALANMNDQGCATMEITASIPTQIAQQYYEVIDRHDERGRCQPPRIVPRDDVLPRPLAWSQLVQLNSVEYNGTTYHRGETVLILVEGEYAEHSEPARIRDIRQLRDGRKQLEIGWLYTMSQAPRRRPKTCFWEIGTEYILSNFTDVVMWDTINGRPEEDKGKILEGWALDVVCTKPGRFRRQTDGHVSWLFNSMTY